MTDTARPNPATFPIVDLFGSAARDQLVMRAEESHNALWLLLRNLDQESKARFGDSASVEHRWLSVDLQHRTLHGVIEMSQMPRLSELIWFDIAGNRISVESKNLPRDPKTGLKPCFSVPNELAKLCELIRHSASTYFGIKSETPGGSV